MLDQVWVDSGAGLFDRQTLADKGLFKLDVLRSFGPIRPRATCVLFGDHCRQRGAARSRPDRLVVWFEENRLPHFRWQHFRSLHVGRDPGDTRARRLGNDARWLWNSRRRDASRAQEQRSFVRLL